MTKNILDTINIKISELQKSLVLLDSVSKSINESNLKSDMIKYWGIERGIQISIECVIDIANIIISTLGLEKPDTYRETILELCKEDILPQEFGKTIANMISFRNILVHDYTRVDEKILINILHNHLEDFTKFMDYVSKWTQRYY
jgi:uncharacterized protein YutE (UPF0331/DUF86 family)